MEKGTILYVGGFILPDKNAAAQRVVSIAKILRDIDYNVVFLNRTPDADSITWKETHYFGFRCFEQKKGLGKSEILRELGDIKYIEHYVEKLNNVVAVIAYNFPAIALRRLNGFCKSKNIKCIGDVTEWYGIKNRSLLYKVVKGTDTFYRMRIVQKRLSGNIVISEFLEDYYSKTTKVVNIPPLVDKQESKWACDCEGVNEGTVLIYAGSPSSEKERLDLIVDSIIKLSRKYAVQLIVIGITKDQFINMYSLDEEYLEFTDCVTFLGKIPHKEVIKQISKADYTVLIRDKNRVNTAGFPTKFVESISCNTAVLANDTSCIAKYFLNGKNGLLVSKSTLIQDLDQVLSKKTNIEVEKDLFDYRNYIEQFKAFMEHI